MWQPGQLLTLEECYTLRRAQPNAVVSVSAEPPGADPLWVPITIRWFMTLRHLWSAPEHHCQVMAVDARPQALRQILPRVILYLAGIVTLLQDYEGPAIAKLRRALWQLANQKNGVRPKALQPPQDHAHQNTR